MKEKTKNNNSLDLISAGKRGTIKERRKNFDEAKKKLYAESRLRHELMTISRQPKQFNLNTWWKKALATVAIGVMGYVGVMIIFSWLVSIITGSLTNFILIDPLAAIIQSLLTGGVIYGCYRGIRRLVRDWGKKK